MVGLCLKLEIWIQSKSPYICIGNIRVDAHESIFILMSVFVFAKMRFFHPFLLNVEKIIKNLKKGKKRQ